MRRRGPVDGEPDARYWAQAAPFDDENGGMGGMDPRDIDFGGDDYGETECFRVKSERIV